MKRLLFCYLLLLFTVGRAGAQDSAARYFDLNKIPASGLTLDKGWVFHAGDEMAWTMPDHPDNDWVADRPDQ